MLNLRLIRGARTMFCVVYRLSVALLMAGVAAVPCFPETDFWVNEMTPPDPVETEADDSTASSVTLENRVSMFQTFKSRNRLDWEQQFKGGVLTQTADYRYVQLSPQSSIQFVDLSGTVLYNDVLVNNLDVGLDWAPIVSYSKRSVGTVQSNFDIGPIIRHSLFSVPYTVRGGIYGYAWSDTLKRFSADRANYHGTPGGYIGCSIGSTDIPIGKLPLFININATGRGLNGNNLSLMTASALLCHELPGWGDSLFIYLGDSLTNGKELYIGEFEGKSLFSNTSWRINHSFSGAAGVKLARRFGVASRVYYRYFINSIAYPSNTTALDDLLRTGNHFGVAVNTDKKRLFSYTGGIEFGREFEDWLFRRKFGSEESATPETRDALIVNQSDHYTNIVRTGDTLRLALPWGLSAVYRLNAWKDSRRYPFKFRDGTSVKVNKNENDRVQIDNALAVRFGRDSLFSVEVYGSYGKIYQYYYRELRSAESRLTHEYRLGLDVGVTAGPFTVRENVYGDAEVSELRYAVNLPPYARDATSSLSGKMTLVEDRLQVTGTWVEMYHDDGYWYGKAYQPDSLQAAGEYYAIERKNTQYWLDFALESFWENHGTVTVGTVLRDVFQRQWDPAVQEYLINELDQGYGIEPYCTIDWQASFFVAKFRLKRIFNTRDKNRFRNRNNWDISLLLQMSF